MVRPATFCVLFCSFCLAAVPGCSSGRQAGDIHADQKLQDPYASVLPDLPQDRAASVAGSLEKNGIDNFNHSLNTVTVGDNISLLSSASEASWAYWQFNPGLAYLDEIQVLLANVNDEALVAVSDYSSGRWEFHGPYDGVATLPLDDARMRSGDGNFYIAVLTSGGNEAQVQKLVLHTESHWNVVTVDSGGAADVGKFSSLVETSTGPAIAYFDETNDDLLFAHSSSATGASASDWQLVRLDSTGNVGQYCSMEIVKGNPAIAFYDESNRVLKYTRSSTAAGADPGDWDYKTVDDGLDENGAFCSLAIVDGRPAVSYFNSDDEDLMYAISANDTGVGFASFWINVKVHQTLGDSTMGFGTSLAEVNGKPQIAYYQFFPFRLHFAWSETAEGDHPSEWNRYQLTTTEPVGSRFDIIELGSSPLVSFYDTDAGSLSVLRSGTGSPDAAFRWNEFTVDGGAAADVGNFSSLAVIGGLPWIAYNDEVNKTLRIARPDSAAVTSSSVWESIAVDGSPGEFTGPSVGTYNSLASIDGWPAISYYDFSNSALKYAILQPPGS